jgi:hypothetical protein
VRVSSGIPVRKFLSVGGPADCVFSSLSSFSHPSVRLCLSNKQIEVPERVIMQIDMKEFFKKLYTLQFSFRLGNFFNYFTLENKLVIYKHILKPIWTYGIELWGCSKPSNTKILQSFQSKTLRMISGAPWMFQIKLYITLHK